jgi:hypothetical protein
MIVEIKKDIFESSDFKELNYLVHILTYKNRYELFIELSIISTCDNYTKLDYNDKEYIEATYNKAVIESKFDKQPNYFVSDTNSNNSFNIDESIRFFNQPISIVLENSLNDHYFIIAIIEHFDTTGNVKKHLKEGWIQFENSGGCTNTENFIEGKLQSFNNLACTNNKNCHDYLRCFVVLDSDKTHSSSSKNHQNVLGFLKKNNVPNHVLEKRCMENYMPDEVFEDISKKEELLFWFKAYQYLNKEQKDFLNINQGFGKKILKKDDLDIQIKELYLTVSDCNFEKLNSGFKLENFKTEFPKNFSSHHMINKFTLNKRCVTNELEQIFQKIEKLL